MTSMTSMTPAPRTEPPARRAHRSAPAAGADPRRLPRLLPDGFAAEPACLADHLARYGPPPPPAGRRRRREELIAEAELAGLAGRGGAGFPTARKLAAVAARRHAVVVGNGSEGEPASAKDKVLMAQSPHLVLDGAAVAADMVGAAEAIIVAHPAVADIIAAAAAERSRARLDRVRISVVPAAGRFVAGEASAVVHWIERGIAKPRATARRLSERGLHGRPTLVQNVETLAHLALVARYGAAWFRAVGTPAEPGSMLVTLAGAVADPGVYEVAIGTPVGEVLARGGGPAAPLGALLIGGYFGDWVDHARAAALPLSDAGLRPAGAGGSPRAGGLTWRGWTAGSARSARAAADASTRTARSGWSPAPCGRSVPRSSCTPAAGARVPRSGRRCCRSRRGAGDEAQGRHDRVRRPRAVRRSAARTSHAGRLGLPDYRA